MLALFLLFFPVLMLLCLRPSAALAEERQTTADGVLREIPVTALEGVRIGQAQDEVGGTGCTVFLLGDGAPAGLDVRGGGPASRESELLHPLAHASFVHAIVLSGGSAYGLGAADGVMRYLNERGIGLDVGVSKVPLVCQSCLFDLTVASPEAHPDADMGYAACVAAESGTGYRDGCFGAGMGATVGKLLGMDACMKSGIGSYAVQLGALKVGAVVAVNALGDVFDWKDGRKVAGMRDAQGLLSTDEVLLRVWTHAVENKFVGNTTLAVILTNAHFDKAALCKIAGMAHDGYARSIRPVHSSADGDSIYAVSLGDVTADKDLVGELAAQTVSEAILRAVRRARGMYGFPAADGTA